MKQLSLLPWGGVSDGSRCKHFLKLHIQEIIAVYGIHLGAASQFASGFSTWSTRFFWESKAYCLETKQELRKWILNGEGRVKTPGLEPVQGQNSFWCYVSPPGSSLPLLPCVDAHWNSLGPAVMESCKEGAGVAYWKKANDLRSSLGQAESFQREACNTGCWLSLSIYRDWQSFQKKAKLLGMQRLWWLRSSDYLESSPTHPPPPVSVGRAFLQTTFVELSENSFSSFLTPSPKTRHLGLMCREIFCFPWLKVNLGKLPCYLLRNNSSKPC